MAGGRAKPHLFRPGISEKKIYDHSLFSFHSWITPFHQPFCLPGPGRTIQVLLLVLAREYLFLGLMALCRDADIHLHEAGNQKTGVNWVNCCSYHNYLEY